MTIRRAAAGRAEDRPLQNQSNSSDLPERVQRNQHSPKRESELAAARVASGAAGMGQVHEWSCYWVPQIGLARRVGPELTDTVCASVKSASKSQPRAYQQPSRRRRWARALIAHRQRRFVCFRIRRLSRSSVSQVAFRCAAGCRRFFGHRRRRTSGGRACLSDLRVC